MPPPAGQTPSPRRTAIALLLIALLWAAVAHLASRGNSSIFDEPLHTAAAIAADHGELGVNAEHPPLWKYVAGLPHAGESWLDLSPETRAALKSDPAVQWTWALNELYHTGRVQGENAVRASRIAMLCFGTLLVLAGGCLAWRLVGPRAAVVAALFLSLDPLLLAHGPIVSNDVAVSLFVLVTLWLASELRAGANWRWAALLGVLVACSACTKYTGVITLPLALGALLLRRRPRFLPAFLTLAVAYVGVWAIYGFRFAPDAGGGLINTPANIARVGSMQTGHASGPASPSDELPVRILSAIESHRLLPQPMTAGLILSYGVTRGGGTFAAGMHSDHGLWWYFPFAAIVKTPLALLAAWTLAAAVAMRSRLRPSTPLSPLRMPQAKCLLTCTLLLLLASMASPLNIGLRHVLPVIVLLSTLAAATISTSPRKLLAVILIALTAETGSAFPHYIPFFNLAGRIIGPEKLLSDSNLDWGQDLARLAEWRAAHPEGNLHLAYWGTADPAAYGLPSSDLPRSTLPPSWTPPTNPGYYAVSISFLQRQRPALMPYYATFANRPSELVGRSIRVFHIP